MTNSISLSYLQIEMFNRILEGLVIEPHDRIVFYLKNNRIFFAVPETWIHFVWNYETNKWDNVKEQLK